MKAASTKKSLIIVIFFLLIIDVVILFFFVSKNKPENSHQHSRKEAGLYGMLKNEADFTDEQIATYEILRKEQFEQVRPLFGEIRKSKDNLYALIYADTITDSTLNALADSIANDQKAIDLQMFAYFRRIRALCTEQQLPKFDSSIKKEVMRMTGRQGRNRSKADSSKGMKTYPNYHK